MKFSLRNIRVLPRWIIFFIDLFCVYAAVFIGFLLRFNFDLSKVASYPWLQIILCVGIVNAACFMIFRPFAGIIRHTGVQDAWRVLMPLVAATLIYTLLNIALSAYRDPFFLPYSVILITLFASFIIMLTYRLLVKAIFDQVANPSGVIRSRVLIYGAGREGMITCKILTSQAQKTSYSKVFAFIDDDPGYRGKHLEGLRILQSTVSNLEKLYERYSFNQVVMTAATFKPNKEAVLEWCLAKRIKILQAPPVSQWMQSKFNPRQIRDFRIEDLLNREVIVIEDKVVAGELKGKIILVTGAAGSIGSELVRQMAGFSPSEIILCEQAESPLHELCLELKDSFPHLKITAFLGDICNRKRMEILFNSYHPQVVFHAAAYKHVPVMEESPSIAVLNNVMGTMYLAELSVAYGVEKFIMISTDKAVNPTNVMGASKRIAEIFIQSLNNHLHNGLQNGKPKSDESPMPVGKDGEDNKEDEQDQERPTVFITTRFGNVLGSNGSVVPRFKKLIEQGGPVTVTHPEVTRFFMTIPEASQLVLQAATMGKGGEIFEFDMGTPVKIANLAHKMILLAGLEPGKDIKIVFTGLRPGEKLSEELLGKGEEVIPTYHDKIKIAQVLTYDFTTVKNDIMDLIRLAQKGDTWNVVKLMKQILPGYKSNNSIYEKLDAAETSLASEIPSSTMNT